MRLVITSATLNGEKFSAYFDDCPVMSVPGRCFPVEVVHSLEDHTRDYLQATVDTALDIHTQQAEGQSPPPPPPPAAATCHLPAPCIFETSPAGANLPANRDLGISVRTSTSHVVLPFPFELLLCHDRGLCVAQRCTAHAAAQCTWWLAL